MNNLARALLEQGAPSPDNVGALTKKVRKIADEFAELEKEAGTAVGSDKSSVLNKMRTKREEMEDAISASNDSEFADLIKGIATNREPPKVREGNVAVPDPKETVTDKPGKWDDGAVIK